MEDLKTDEASLDKKIKKKAAELERNQKRLESLHNVRPAFMDEYEKLEDELQDLYRDYLERFRNLDYIENQLETHNKQEQERMEENEKQMKRMQKKLKEDEMKVQPLWIHHLCFESRLVQVVYRALYIAPCTSCLVHRALYKLATTCMSLKPHWLKWRVVRLDDDTMMTRTRLTR